jgi:hypothetical protein
MQRFVTISRGPRDQRQFLGADGLQERDFRVTARFSGSADDTEIWVLTDTGGGRFTLLQATSGRYLDAHEIQSRDFRAVTRRQQKNDTQLWRFIGTGTLRKIQQVSSNRFLQPRGTTSGDFQVVTRPESDNGSQEWLVRDSVDVTLDRSDEFNTPPAAGSPTACVIPGLGVYDIAYRDTSGRLHDLWRDSNGATGTTNLTTSVPGGAPLAAGDPFVYVDTLRNTEILLYRGRDDKEVHSLYWSTGDVGHDRLSDVAGTPHAGGNPVGYYTPSIDAHNVVYRRSDGHLQLLSWTGIAPVTDGGNLTEATQEPRAVGTPTAFVGSADFNWVIYRSVDQRIIGLTWKVGGTISKVLSAGAQLPAGDPVGYYTAHDDTHQVIYRDAHGDLWELFWQGDAGVQVRNLTASTPGAVAATGTPAAYYSAGTNTHHVIYRTELGLLHDIGWQTRNSTPQLSDRTIVHAPSSSARLAGFTVEGPNTQHVAYRGDDNHIHEARRAS